MGRSLRILSWVACGIVLGAAPSAAQQVVQYEVRYYARGAAQPTSTQVIPAASFLCGQAAPADPSTVNPTRIVFDDAAHVGQVCVYQAQPGDPLLAFPVGQYEGAVVAVDDAGLVSAESNRAPFSWRPPPRAPTGFAAIR